MENREIEIQLRGNQRERRYCCDRPRDHSQATGGGNGNWWWQLRVQEPKRSLSGYSTPRECSFFSASDQEFESLRDQRFCLLLTSVGLFQTHSINSSVSPWISFSWSYIILCFKLFTCSVWFSNLASFVISFLCQGLNCQQSKHEEEDQQCSSTLLEWKR